LPENQEKSGRGKNYFGSSQPSFFNIFCMDSAANAIIGSQQIEKDFFEIYQCSIDLGQCIFSTITISVTSA